MGNRSQNSDHDHFLATHSSILAWRIPWTEEPGGLKSMVLQRVGHNRATNTLGIGKCSFRSNHWAGCCCFSYKIHFSSYTTVRLRDGSLMLHRIREDIETCILSRVKQITSPGWMHETSAQTWWSGKTWRERVEREVGGGNGMGKTCKLKAVSFQCMTKFTTN